MLKCRVAWASTPIKKLPGIVLLALLMTSVLAWRPQQQGDIRKIEDLISDQQEIDKIEERASDRWRNTCPEARKYDFDQFDRTVARTVVNLGEGLGLYVYLAFIIQEIALSVGIQPESITDFEDSITDFLNLTFCSPTFVQDVAADLEKIPRHGYNFIDYHPDALTAFLRIAEKAVALFVNDSVSEEDLAKIELFDIFIRAKNPIAANSKSLRIM